MSRTLVICFTLLSGIVFGQSNLIGYWPLDSSAIDISGNNYHGVIHGAVPDTGHTGLPNTAYRFDGWNDYIVISEDSAFDFETLDTFEITFWMKPDLNFIGGSSNDMISKWRDYSTYNDDYPFCIRILNTTLDNGKIYGARFSRSCYQTPRTNSDSSLRDSSWHFVQFSRSSDDSIRLYVDGFLQETTWDSTTCSTSNNDSLYFGRKGGNKNHGYYKGLLDDIKIFGGRIYGCSLDVGVSIYTDSIRANYNHADHYQWYKCTSSGLVLLPYDTSRSMSNMAAGTYAVVLDKGGCIDTSACYYFSPLQNNCLIGDWPLNGNANDFSGNAFHGTVYGATATTGRTGSSSTAYQFDGVNDYVKISHDSLFNFNTNDTFAISLWAKLTSTTQNLWYGGSNTLLSKWEDTSNFNADFPYDIRLFNQTTTKNGKIFANRFSRVCLQYPSVESQSSINDGLFHHILFTRSSDDSLRLYIDGKLESTEHDNTFCGTTNILDLEFGRRGGWKNPAYFKGIIDDVKIYGTCPSGPPPSGPCGLDSTLTITGNALISNENNAKHYQWYKCDSGLTLLPYDTIKVFYPSANGKYLVVISSDTCSDTSACMTFTNVGISAMEKNSTMFTVYPNPSSDEINLQISYEEGIIYTIYSSLGNEVDAGILSSRNIDIAKLPDGFYILHLSTKKGILRSSFVKN